ncbi:MAG: hypothetical protein GY749_18890 [Desulfobacteraceae bacterium]|nr:hypothetical protein [Desulfobacteraceae bacterium]
MKKKCLISVLLFGFVLSALTAHAGGNIIGKFVQDNTTFEVASGKGTEISVTINTALAGSIFLYTDLVLFNPAGAQVSEYVWDEVYKTGQTASVKAVYNDGSEEPSFIISFSVHTENNGLLETYVYSIYVNIENNNVTFNVTSFNL